jgi:predicted phosphodiesterase
MPTRISEEQFIECFNRLRSPQLVADELGLPVRAVHSRRDRLQQRLDIDLRTVDMRKPSLLLPENQLRAELTLSDCSIIVFSDAHYWPDLISTAHMALIEVIQTLPNVGAIVANGDVFDGATTGRHARIGWATTPTTKQELEAVQDRLGEIEAVAPKGAKLIRTWGNHDIRFDSRLSNAAPEYEGIHGLALSDHIPMWKACWSLMVNDNVMIKHRYHNGIHATYNNALKAGRSIVTGHLHRLCVTPWGDYNGRRWGVDTGTLADPDGPQFAYSEDNPKPHCAGFAVLTFDDRSEMLPPELCEVVNGRAYFRGRRVDV